MTSLSYATRACVRQVIYIRIYNYNARACNSLLLNSTTLHPPSAPFQRQVKTPPARRSRSNPWFHAPCVLVSTALNHNATLCKKHCFRIAHCNCIRYFRLPLPRTSNTTCMYRSLQRRRMLKKKCRLFFLNHCCVFHLFLFTYFDEGNRSFELLNSRRILVCACEGQHNLRAHDSVARICVAGRDEKKKRQNKKHD